MRIKDALWWREHLCWDSNDWTRKIKSLNMLYSKLLELTLLCMVVVFQSLSRVWLSNTMDCSTTGLLSLAIFQSLFKLMCIETVMPSNHLILCHPLLLLPSIFPSIRVFSNESALCIRWPEYWSFGISLPKDIQDWFPLGLIGLISLQSKGLSRVFSNTTVQNHQFFGAQPSLWFNSHFHTWLLEKP